MKLLDKMRALVDSGYYLSNDELDSNLKYILGEVRKIEPAAYPCFAAMYFTGCRASESIDVSRWTILTDSSYILNTLKNNDPRYFSNFDLPFEFQLYLEQSVFVPYSINYERLRYLFKMFSNYPRIWIGKKESTCHLFRHNYVKKLIHQGLTNEEIRVKLGERNMKSALSYINSRYRI